MLLVLIGCAGPQHTVGTTDEAAPMKSAVIIVDTGLDAEAAYRKAVQQMTENGFTVASSDPVGMVITSEERRVRSLYIVASVTVGGSGVVRIRARNDFDYPVDKEGQIGSPARDAWKALHLYAESLGGTITYE